MSTLVSGQRVAHRRGRGDAVQAGHLDVEQRDVGPVLGHGRAAPRAPEPTSATTSRSGSRPSSADSAPRTSAWSSASSSRIGALIRRPPAARSPRGSSTRVSTVPPTAAARSRSPTSPLPVRVPARRRSPHRAVPSSTTSAASAASRTRAARGAAVPDHVGDPLAHRPGEQLAQVRGHLVGGVRQVGLDLGGGQRGAGPGQLAGQGQLAVALDGAAYVGERVAGEPLEVGELGAGPLGVDVEQPVGELGLDRDDGQRVAEDVVQVAGEPGALVLDGELGVLLRGRGPGRCCGPSSAGCRTPPATPRRSRTAGPTGLRQPGFSRAEQEHEAGEHQHDDARVRAAARSMTRGHGAVDEGGRARLAEAWRS